MSTRRGFVLIAVLVVVASALLIGTSVIFIAQSEVAGSRGMGDAVQSRALAQSGLRIIMHRLNEQRDDILRGEQPMLDRQYNVYEIGNRVGVVRLLPIGPDNARLVPEAAKLDLNEADLEMLAAMEQLDERRAEAIVQRRGDPDEGGFRSVMDLLSINGFTPEDVYGPLDELRWLDDAQASLGESVQPIVDVRQPTAFADLLTVFAVEPPLQRDSRRRINLNVEWSDELGERIDDRFGRGAGDLVKQIIDGGTTFDRDARIVQALRRFDVAVDDWPDILDALTTREGEYHFGRVDINSAPAAVLEVLPGISPEQATSMVRAREGLSQQERETIVWPVLQGIVEPEQFQEIVDHITTRSWTYRLRIAAGEVDEDDPDGPLSRPLIVEAVIDLASPAPRVAFLRDATMLQMAARISEAAESLDGSRDSFRRDDDGFITDFDDERREDAPIWRDDVFASMMEGSAASEEKAGDPFAMDLFGDERVEQVEADETGRQESGGSSHRRRIGRWQGP